MLKKLCIHILTTKGNRANARSCKEVLRFLAMTGQALRELLVEKWGYPYDVQFLRRGDRRYFQVMWRYLGQASFALTEEQYMVHLERVAYILDEWAVTETVCRYLAKTRERPRVGKAISVPLDS